jgi:hypothetical protein
MVLSCMGPQRILFAGVMRVRAPKSTRAAVVSKPLSCRLSRRIATSADVTLP